MREILFRGKRINSGGWVEGAYMPHYYSTRYGKVAAIFTNDDVLCKTHRYPVDPTTVGQYTGLTDKNGKKIFEGDIVAQNWYDHDEPSDDSFGEVVFCEYDCSFSVMDIQKDGIVPLGRCHAYHWEVEVIGNIHDNSELLENQ